MQSSITPRQRTKSILLRMKGEISVRRQSTARATGGLLQSKRRQSNDETAGVHSAVKKAKPQRWTCEVCNRERDLEDKTTQWDDPNDNGSCCSPYDICIMCFDASEGRRPQFTREGDSGWSDFYGDCGTCHRRRECWCAAHAKLTCSEEARAKCCKAEGGCRVVFCKAVDDIPYGRHYREGNVSRLACKCVIVS